MIFRVIIGGIAGGGLGFAYYRFVGCPSGTCPLTSNPIISTICGMVVGALIGSSLR
jgi:hypothetical protein